MTCTNWRKVEARIDWFLTHNPSGAGMCAQHSWHSLGGNLSPACPPAWGCRNANAVYDKVKASGRYFTTAPPRGALIVWKYGSNGHAALSVGDGKIATTDPKGRPGKTGIEPITYPETAWGASAKARIWTDQYNGVRFDVATTGGSSVNIYDYVYGGKPTKDQTLTTTYTRITDSRIDPARAGWESRMLYINVKPTFASGKVVGVVRLRSIRADGDATAYQDYTVHKDALIDGKFLITHTYWESGDGQPSHWEARVGGGIASAVASTRYTKNVVVSDRG